MEMGINLSTLIALPLTPRAHISSRQPQSVDLRIHYYSSYPHHLDCSASHHEAIFSFMPLDTLDLSLSDTRGIA